ncbi:hypothetical protein [Leptothoe spongobia]|uniref:Uncharacterized protein n=1 Tax=Leptothoe spongobia TAU-MAC 1115 TaxID=1967444 RepID=A0A947DH30_9CYAN|nr:hypothetical protein [Leptothoe spongobia]MBT9316474.1 hypothetical protein [Leptothoe spongobia TAU-MAC 1115]
MTTYAKSSILSEQLVPALLVSDDFVQSVWVYAGFDGLDLSVSKIKLGVADPRPGFIYETLAHSAFHGSVNPLNQQQQTFK